MELSGIIKVIFEEKSFPSGFSIREFVITTEDRYPSDILFQLNKEKADLIREYKPGDRVKVSFDLRGRESNGRYFNSVVAWRLDREGAAATAPPAQYAAPQPAPPSYSPSAGDGPEDDLPF